MKERVAGRIADVVHCCARRIKLGASTFTLVNDEIALTACASIEQMTLRSFDCDLERCAVRNDNRMTGAIVPVLFPIAAALPHDFDQRNGHPGLQSEKSS